MLLKRKPIYKCELLSISPDSRINCDESLRENVKHAETLSTIELLVQPTIRQGYFKEILTGRKIPVYRIQKHLGDHYSIDDFYYHFVPKSPCFIQFQEKILGEGHLENNLVEATYDDVENYLNLYSREELNEELDEIFHRGEVCYRTLEAKGEVSDSQKIKRLLKK